VKKGKLSACLLLGLVLTADPSEFNGLGEGPNGGGWENWKVELLLLSIQSGTHICGTAVVRTLQSSSLIKQRYQVTSKYRAMQQAQPLKMQRSEK
jgi:hypothetical protein